MFPFRYQALFKVVSSPLTSLASSFVMDGLSSASGVFAAVSIAIELAATIRKIVKFGKAVKDAPTQIRALFQDLEVLDAVITRIEQLNQHVAVDNVSEKALQNCQIKLLKLQNVIDQAQLNIKSKSRFRRNWGAFKFVLNEAEIQSIQASIQEAKSTLQLAQTQSLVYVFSTASIFLPLAEIPPGNLFCLLCIAKNKLLQA